MALRKWKTGIKPHLGNIYLLQWSEYDVYKIGWTTYHPKKRVTELKPYFKGIRLVDFVYTRTGLESDLHNLFSEDKYVNEFGFNEFFWLSEKNVKYILDLFESLRHNSLNVLNDGQLSEVL